MVWCAGFRDYGSFSLAVPARDLTERILLQSNLCAEYCAFIGTLDFVPEPFFELGDHCQPAVDVHQRSAQSKAKS
jgi:hypothetical protein